MRRHETRPHIDLEELEPIEGDRPARTVKAHANPRRRGEMLAETPRDDRHHVHQLLHDAERGLIPDDLA